MTDHRAMRRVLTNLVSNAVKFTQREDFGRQSVLIAVRLRLSACRIDVLDTGIGIPADKLEEVWRPFHQLGNLGRNRENGLGLGLFLVRRMMDGLPNHAICLASNFGRGSRFTIALPSADSPSRVTSEVSRIDDEYCDVAVGDLTGTRILVLDDDLLARLALVDLLNSFGAIVSCAPTLHELLDEHRSAGGFADLLVCDYRLTDGMTAIEAVAEISLRLGYSPSVVIVTGETNAATIQERVGRETRVLQKPFAVGELFSTLNSVVQAGRRRRDLGLATSRSELECSNPLSR
jgi:CheY-like chemotaxis protein